VAKVTKPNVGILGGTGPAGRGVAVRLAAGGRDVVIGSRDASRAREVAAGLASGAGSITGAANDDAARCAVVVVATPFDSTLATVRALRDELAGKVVISMVNALTRVGKEMVPLYPGRGSMAAEVAAVLPESRVVGAFHHLPADQMADLSSDLAADVAVVGDDPAARAAVVELVDSMPGLRAREVGSLSLAGAVEAFTAVCITLNVRHRAHTYVVFEGLER
jgi:8-hydroxy-5-deazaflavin:NADPH oxidoreductase